MAYVPKGAPKGKKSKEQFHNIVADDIDVDSAEIAGMEISSGATVTNMVPDARDLKVILPGHAATDLFIVEDDASHVRFSIAGDGTLVLPDNSIDNDMIADDAVAPANILGFAKDSAGVTIVALTAAIGDPATLNEGAIYVVKDTADADKIKLVAVKGGAFYVGAALTAAA